MTTETNPILLIGANKSGKSHIISSIFPNSTLHPLRRNEANESNFLSTVKVCLDTKYYSTIVEFCEVSSEEFSMDHNDDVDFQAIVMVVDSLSHLQQFTKEILDGKETRILILNHNGNARQIFTESDVHRCREWCTERGVEFMTFPHDSSESSSIQDDENATNRLRAALECNMWKHMIIKPRDSAPKNTPQKPIANFQTTHQEELRESDASSKSSQQLNDIDPQQDLIRQLLTNATIGDNNAMPQDNKDEDDEHLIEETDSFDKLLHQMMHLKQEGHLIQHEERKERAGQLIMQLMNMWGDEDDAEEGSEDVSSDDGDDE
mmetsp:Transcript_3016/g.11579  ORF Transcript_3016/g.11579 Transcript_3016/m.11579 type:complete len:320 (-) Transcript_3016:251-1210(-)